VWIRPARRHARHPGGGGDSVSTAEQCTGCGRHSECGRQRACSSVSRRIGSREQAELTSRGPHDEL
jgi:hypothetical protein